MNKSEVCVKLTKKNIQNVCAALVCFNQEILPQTRSWLSMNKISYPYIQFIDGFWRGISSPHVLNRDIEVIKYKKLFDILEEESIDITPQVSEVDPVETKCGLIDGFTRYTQEVLVNHYSDQEFHVHKKKSTADHLCHLNGDLGRHVKTIKATLTYDIPMTKV